MANRILLSVFFMALTVVVMPTLALAGVLDERYFSSAAELKYQYDGFNQFLLWIILAICAFVLALLTFVVLRYRAGANPTPNRFSHNAVVEVIWTLVPVIILVVIAIPSLRLLSYQVDMPANTDVTVKVVGQQWYWDYEYVDEGFGFSSFMIGQGAATAEEAADELREAGFSPDEWMLATDNAMVVPVGKNIRVQVTADPTGVIHGWTVPALGIKIDSVPGRLNETWFNADKEGIYYGQCSKLCGINHSYMPIMVKVVSEEEYAQWLLQAREEHGSLPADRQFAQAD